MDAYTQAALDAGLPPELAASMPRYVQIESGGNPNAQTGSYSGLLQMGPDEAKQYGGNGLDAGARMYADNNNWFQGKFGNAPTPGQLYIVAQQGRGGIAAHMANPDAPAWQNMYSTAEGQQKGANWAKKAIWGNVPTDMRSQFPNGVDGLTSGQFMDLWDHKVAHTPMSQAMSSGAPKMADPQADQGSLSGRFMSGGPGALFGAPNGVFPGQDGTPGTGYDLGGALQGAAASLAAIYSPSGSAAMMNAMNMPKFKQNFSVFTDPYGRQGVLDHRSGRTMFFGPNGQMVNPGSGGASDGTSDTATQLANTPKALQERLKLDQETSSKKMEALETAAANADAFIDQNKYAMKLSKDPGTLQGPGMMNLIRDKLADLTNGTFGGIDIAKQHELEKLHSQLVATSLAGQPGVRFAAPEIKFGETSSASLDKPAATNQQIYSQNIQNAERTKAVRDIARRHMQTRGVLGPEFSKELQEYQKANPVYQGDAVQTSEGPSGGQRPPLSSFYQ